LSPFGPGKSPLAKLYGNIVVASVTSLLVMRPRIQASDRLFDGNSLV
jgi:hypothetical protein